MTSRPVHSRVDSRPLVVHIVYRFAVGGLENGVVNLVNRMPAEAFRHAIVALTEVTEFRERILREDVRYFSLHKRPGHGVRAFPALYRLLRQLAPAIVHTRNLAALEACLPAWAARVPVRVHGEHGWEVADLDGSRRRYRLVRRVYGPFVSHYVTVSRHLDDYLHQRLGVTADRIAQIHNGVDTERFRPAHGQMRGVPGLPFTAPGLWLVGSVGRMDAVKDQLSLVQGFARAVRLQPAAKERMRLVLVGDGPQRATIEAALRELGVRELAWLPGERADVAEIMRALDCFVLPSLAEGISNTILEAMASGLPVVATRVGGNAELVEAGATGQLVSPADPDAIARAVVQYLESSELARRHGDAGRDRVEQRFSLARMVSSYEELYTRLLAARGFAGAGLHAA